MNLKTISVVIPAFNEEMGVAAVISHYRDTLQRLGYESEIIVVDDGSADATAERAAAAGAVVVRNPSNKGYGYSLLRGITVARHSRVAITDADETYPAEALPELLAHCDRFDMVVGQRTGPHYRGGLTKCLSRFAFRFLAEFTTGTRIPDINSGLRVFPRDFVLKHRRSISTGYSFTTTLTLIALMEGLHLKYVPIAYERRTGSSKIHWVRDSLRSLQIITEAILVYNPLKFFMLLALAPLLLLAAQWIIHGLVGAALLPAEAGTAATAAAQAFGYATLILALGCLAFVSNMRNRRE